MSRDLVPLLHSTKPFEVCAISHVERHPLWNTMGWLRKCSHYHTFDSICSNLFKKLFWGLKLFVLNRGPRWYQKKTKKIPLSYFSDTVNGYERDSNRFRDWITVDDDDDSISYLKNLLLSLKNFHTYYRQQKTLKV